MEKPTLNSVSADLENLAIATGKRFDAVDQELISLESKMESMQETLATMLSIIQSSDQKLNELIQHNIPARVAANEEEIVKLRIKQ